MPDVPSNRTICQSCGAAAEVQAVSSLPDRGYNVRHFCRPCYDAATDASSVEPRRALIAHINRCLGGGEHDGPHKASRRFAQLVNECTSATARVGQLEVENNFLRDEVEHLNRKLYPTPTPADEARYAQASADAAKRRVQWQKCTDMVWETCSNMVGIFDQVAEREKVQSLLLAITERIETESCKLDAQADALESAECQRSGKWIEDDFAWRNVALA